MKFLFTSNHDALIKHSVLIKIQNLPEFGHRIAIVDNILNMTLNFPMSQ